jgi:hypothetical protein
MPNIAVERLSNLGYLGLVKEATAGIALTPTDYIPMYNQTLNTNMNFVDQQPIAGTNVLTFATIQGQRDHKGDFTVVAEPNTSAKLFDMLLTKTSTTGAGPTYTHTFDHSGANPNSYTIDISYGNIVSRYYGVKASKITPTWNKTELQWKVSVSALGSFQGRALSAAPTGSGTFTVVLSTAYDPSPTTGLVAGDLIRFYHSGAAYIDATVLAVIDGVSFTTSTSVVTMTTGDMVYLRPATVAFTLQPSFIWPKTKVQLAATATAALAAAQTRVETGTTYELTHNFNKDTGEDRSGGFDPAALIHTTVDVTFTLKKFFDQADDIANMQSLVTTAAAIIHQSGATNQYNTTIVFNSLKTDGAIVPTLSPNGVPYSEIKYHPVYNSTDAKEFYVIITNALATI